MAPGYLTDQFALKIECMFGTLATTYIYIPFQLLINSQVTLFHILLET